MKGKTLKTLQVIPEETEANDSDVPQQEFMAGLGLPKGVQMDTNLFQVVGVETVFQERVEDLQFENLDFILTEEEKDHKQIAKDIVKDSKNRGLKYVTDYSYNKGIKVLWRGGHRNQISAVIACLMRLE